MLKTIDHVIHAIGPCHTCHTPVPYARAIRPCHTPVPYARTIRPCHTPVPCSAASLSRATGSALRQIGRLSPALGRSGGNLSLAFPANINGLEDGEISFGHEPEREHPCHQENRHICDEVSCPANNHATTLSTYMCTHMSMHMSTHMSIHVSRHMSIYISIHCTGCTGCTGLELVALVCL